MTKLTSIGIRNFRSFNEEGVLLEKISQVNIIIGKNNCGKSNVLRFLKLISENVNDLQKFAFPNILNSHKYTEIPAMALGFDHAELHWPSNIKQNSFNSQNEPLINHIGDPMIFWLTLDGRRITIDELPTILKQLEIHSLAKFVQNRNSIYSQNSLLDEITSNFDKSLHEKIKVFKDLIYVPELRVINPSSGHNFGNSEINGINIIEKLFEMQHPDTGKENEKKTFNKLETLIKSLLNADNLILEVPHNKDKILITMNGKRLPLENYGSGIYQIILLCAALVIYDNRIVTIEEPETHLHPELQRKFLDFLVNETNNTYFITTHSNVFINYSKKISIYHMEHNGNYSSLTRVENTKKSYKLLDDLGYKASDIIQANGVIWVEGPSDRNYILKWISMIDNTLEEGLHFSIMFYGGKNLANVSFNCNDLEFNKSASEKLIPLLRINRNATVIIDSDMIGRKTDINDTKKRIQEEVGEQNCWITKGKEIENYIGKAVIKKWLGINDIVENDKNVINDLFAETVKSIDGAIDYNKRKTFFSAQLATHFSEEDLSYNGLKNEVQKTVNLIRKWNHF